MKRSHLVLLGSLAVGCLALVPATRAPKSGGLGKELNYDLTSRSPKVPEGVLKKRLDIQYDGHLPDLPAGWPNMTAVQERQNSNSESRAVAIRARGDLATRDDPGNFSRNLFMGLKIYAVANAAVNWFGLIEACKQFTQETGNAFQCLFGAIAQVIALVTLGHQIKLWRGQLGDHLTANGWHVAGINKRDEWLRLMTRELSTSLKTEVRHLGTWGGVDTSNQKRDSGPAAPHEVFGVSGGGQDFHFTYMGRDSKGKDSFKLGLGDGSALPNSKGRRQTQITNSNFYFTTGGIDFAAESVENEYNPEWSWVSPNDAIEFGDIYDSVSCYFGSFLSFENGRDNAINFQVYDSYIDATLSAGIMSPFSASQNSAIRSMSITGGLGHNSCGAFS